MKKNESFLYQLNINRKKYPDICKVLEEEKENNGIAFYLRNLIKEDIKKRNGAHFETSQNMNKNTAPIQPKESVSSTKIEDEELGGSGGFI